jgi:hypothetical protein
MMTSATALADSPRYSTLELKLGNYFPLIDSEKGLHGQPWAETFGGNAGMLRFDMDMEGFVYQGWGSLAMGIGIGYGEKFADAHDDTGAKSPVQAGMRFYEVRAVVEYRFDTPALKWNIPLVPYVKAGLSMDPWQAAVGTNVEATPSGLYGQGIRYGYFFTGGVSLMLDFLDQQATRDVDAEIGINHFYLFVEYNFQQVDSFGAPGLDLSSRRLMFGIALDI